MFGVVVAMAAEVVVPGTAPLAFADSSSSQLAASAGLGYTPLNPVRILDTREGVGAPRAKLGPASTLKLRASGKANVPTTGVDSVVLNVTAVAPTGSSSFMTVWPDGEARPDASSLNYVAGQTVPNLVIAKLGKFDSINFYNESGEVHVLADIVGYYADTSDFTGLSPRRILNTRDGTGAPEAPVGAGQKIDLTVLGKGSVPTSGVGSVVLNVTATRGTARSFATVWPAGQAQPFASNVNFEAFTNVPNLVIVKVGAGGKVSLANDSGSVHLIADVVGYFLDDASYVGVTPSRILNTRDGTGAPAAKIGPGKRIDVSVLDVGSVPKTNVRAVVLNVTVAAPDAESFITLWPAGSGKPKASSLNMVAGKNVANLVIAKVGVDGQVSIENEFGSTHVIADVVGYIDASAGADLPANLAIPASNDWSAATWTVKTATLREQDRESGSFAEDQYDTPFFLEVDFRVRNNASTTQKFEKSYFALAAAGVTLPIVDASFFSTLSVSAGATIDFDMSFAIGWGEDLGGLQLALGGGTLVPGTVNMVGAQTVSTQQADVGTSFSGSNFDEVCTAGAKVTEYQSLTAVWTTTLPASSAAESSVSTRQARDGHRWLVLRVLLDGTLCSAANVFEQEFLLDVDASFIGGSLNVNELFGTSFMTSLSIELAYEVPQTATNVKFIVGNAGTNEHNLSVANL